ncbi:Tat (Twin-arginine translocation) pathway signal sequence [Candidatus Electronema halotolerans]
MKNELTRRDLLTYTAISAAGLLLPAASEAGIWSWIIRLQPTRLLAGLIFDVAEAVVVSLVADAIVNNLSHRHYSRAEAYQSFGSNLSFPELRSLGNETNFKPVPYKASVITLGIADYELHPQRTFKMQINSEAEKQRFHTVLDYLEREKIKIKIAGMGYAKPANEFEKRLEPDDLLTLERWQLHGDQEAHVKELIAATGVSAFDELMA